MTPLPMAPWVFLFGLATSCVFMWGAGAETPQAAPHDTWCSKQGVVSAETLQNVLEQFTRIKAQFHKQGMVPAKTYPSTVEWFVRVRAQLRDTHEERHREWEARLAWETQASSWHTTFLAIEGVVLLLVICCGLKLRGLWTSSAEASTHSDTWHSEQGGVEESQGESRRVGRLAEKRKTGCTSCESSLQ